MNPTNLLGLTQQELANVAERLGESRYRGKQLFQWLYAKQVTSFSAMTDVSKDLREELARSYAIEFPALELSQRSGRDGTMKFLFTLSDGAKIESVLIPPRLAFQNKDAADEEEQRRLTVCISTQVGCPLDCKFCATASMGYLRNLTVGEIVGQVLLSKRISGRNITNVVFMGMGEPFMNYENVMKAAEIIIEGIGIAARRVTVSTAGWADRIRQMADEQRKVKLAVSLHSANNNTRLKLMPIAKKYNLSELMSALEYYHRKTRKRVTYEYIFFDGVNDSDKDVAQLVKLARRVPCKINVIPYHSIDFVTPTGISAALRPSPRMEQIVEQLRAHNLTVFIRSNAGEDIDAACGQLAVKTKRLHRSHNVRNGRVPHSVTSTTAASQSIFPLSSQSR
jgi:23S rRNA (adenine2503-C2)-methyltransferase